MGGWDAPWHWIVLAVVVLALFYSRRLPDAARSLGRSLRIFRTEIKGMGEDDKARAQATDEADAEPKALPAAEVIKRESAANANGDAQRARPRPSPTSQRRS